MRNKIISKLFQRLIVAHEYFLRSMSLKWFWNNFRTPSVAKIMLFQFQTWLHVKQNYFEIISELFQCFISRVSTTLECCISAWSGLLGDAEDIELRIEKYGVNVIPRKPPPSFLQLAWEASQDPLLIILFFSAFITIGLSFYQPPPDDAEGTLQDHTKL